MGEGRGRLIGRGRPEALRQAAQLDLGDRACGLRRRRPAPAESPARSRAPRRSHRLHGRVALEGLLQLGQPLAMGRAARDLHLDDRLGRGVRRDRRRRWCYCLRRGVDIEGVSVAPDLPAAAELGEPVMSEWPEPMIRLEDSQEAPAESKEESKEGSEEPTEAPATSPCPRRRDRSRRWRWGRRCGRHVGARWRGRDRRWRRCVRRRVGGRRVGNAGRRRHGRRSCLVRPRLSDGEQRHDDCDEEDQPELCTVDELHSVTHPEPGRRRVGAGRAGSGLGMPAAPQVAGRPAGIRRSASEFLSGSCPRC